MSRPTDSEISDASAVLTKLAKFMEAEGCDKKQISALDCAAAILDRVYPGVG